MSDLDKKYVVTTLKVVLRNNKTAVSGDIVTGNQLPNLIDAVNGNFVKLHIEEKEKEAPEYMSLKKPDLIAYAKKNGYEIDSEANKDVIQKAMLAQDAKDALED